MVSSLLSVAVDAATVYTWKDASGVTHFSDKPFPQARSSREVEIKAARPKRDVVAESSADSEQAKPKQNLFDASDKKRLNAECSKARKNLVSLASGKKVRRTNQEGENVVLDEASIQSEVQKNQTFISSYCRAEELSDSSTTDDNQNDEGQSDEI